MGLFDQLVKTAARVVALPVSVAADVVNAFDIDRDGPLLGDSETAKHLIAFREDIEHIPASVDEE